MAHGSSLCGFQNYAPSSQPLQPSLLIAEDGGQNVDVDMRLLQSLVNSRGAGCSAHGTELIKVARLEEWIGSLTLLAIR